MKARLHAVAASVALSLASGMALSADGHDHEHKGQVFGTVKFANSCDPKVQPLFQAGVAALHSFYYSAAEKAFRETLVQDPSCGIANWGIAAILMFNPLGGQGATPQSAEAAQAAIEAGRRNPPKTQRERDYIEAVAAYYENWAGKPERERQQTRSKAFEALAARYPDDNEAQIFSALYIAGTQSQSDQTYGAYLRAAGILEKQFAKDPQHPGVAHYLIHSYDAPPLAEKGVSAARRYASLAPDAPHALHMPSHIFTRIGAWEESAATNRRSHEAAKKANEPHESYHSTDYTVYAYLQLGRDSDAKRAMDEVMAVKFNPAVRTAPYAMAAMPARYALERGAWREAMELKVTDTKFLYPEANTYFARALGAARAGEPAVAQKEAEALERIHKQLLERKDAYWATEVEVQRLTVAGWIALTRGNRDEALKSMRAAADMEDRNEKNIVTPARMLPARELLADMLLETKQPALALKEYETSQTREPNRFRGLYGAALAAEGAGDRRKAGEYYAKLAEVAKKADTSRSEVKRARAYVADAR